MKRLTLFLSGFFSISMLGCAAQIEKERYSTVSNQTAVLDCSDIAITKRLPVPSDSITVVGKIRASDSGLSAECSKSQILDIFREEACSQHAHAVHIITEKHPDIWSTCYRAQAEFVRFNDEQFIQLVQSDADYTGERLSKSSRETECLNKGFGPAGVLGGAIGGAVLYGVCSNRSTDR